MAVPTDEENSTIPAIDESHITPQKKKIVLSAKQTRTIIFKVIFFTVSLGAVTCFIGLLTDNIGFGFFFASLTLLSIFLLYIVFKWRFSNASRNSNYGDTFCFMKRPSMTARQYDVEQNQLFMLTQDEDSQSVNSLLGPLRPLNYPRRSCLIQSEGHLMRYQHCIEPSPINSLRGGVLSDTNLFTRTPPPYSTFDKTLPSYEQLEQMIRTRSESAVQGRDIMEHERPPSYVHTVTDEG